MHHGNGNFHGAGLTNKQESLTMTPKVNVLDRHDPVNALHNCNAEECDNRIKTNALNSAALNSSIHNFNSMPIEQLRLIKKPEVLSLIGISKSTLHVRINKGLLPPPIPLGERAVAFVLHEIKTVIRAQIAGCTNEEIEQLVSVLVRLRHETYASEVQTCNIQVK